MRSLFFFLASCVLLAIPPAAVAAEGSVANGVFLVARRELRDPNFRHTVVLVTQPKMGGPFGVIINRPLEHKLSEVFDEFDALKDRKDVLYFGGPVQADGVVFLVRTKTRPPRAMNVLKDVYFTGDSDLLEELLQRKNPTEGLKVFAGYSGWGPGQLQQEIARGDWYILPASAATIFEEDASKIWPELIKRAGVRKTHHAPGLVAADPSPPVIANPKPQVQLAADRR